MDAIICVVVLGLVAMLWPGVFDTFVAWISGPVAGAFSDVLDALTA
jgi:hypothetical protein